MPTIGSKKLEQKVIIETFARLCLDGSLSLGNVPEWAENQEKRKHWLKLKDLSFLDIYQEMKRLESLTNKEKPEPEPQKDEKKEEEKATSREVTSPPKPKKKKIGKFTEEEAREIGDRILEISPMNEIGGKLSKKEIIQQMELSEEEVNAGLSYLKDNNKVKTKRGRNAKWERIA